MCRRSIVLDHRVNVKDGKIPRGKILKGTRLTVRHEWVQTLSERILFEYRDAIVLKVLRGKRAVVKYDVDSEDVGNDVVMKNYTVHANQMRELGSVPKLMMRGASSMARRTKSSVQKEEEEE